AAAIPSDGTSTTSSRCRTATASSTRAAVARHACSRCPTAICTPGLGCLRKSTEIFRPEAFHGGGRLACRGRWAARAGNLSRRGMLPAGKGGYKAPPGFRNVGAEPAPLAPVANESNGSGAAPSVTDGVFQDKSNLWALALGSVGVVYGDIGTSPLYAFRVAVVAAVESGPVRRDIVLGVLSLILWALIVVVAVKYVLLLLRADNNGEGGTLSLTALATRAFGRRTALVFLLGVVGASMFLGDAVITPAISVLSAVEGLTLVTPAFEHSVVPLTIAILLGLFAGQSRGTARVASFFAPVMVIWFVSIAAAGLLHI